MSRIKPKTLPSQERLHEVLDYDASTGLFTWKRRAGNSRAINSWNAKHVGKRAGSYDPHGYVTIGIDGVRYFAHRLAWVYVYGEPPKIEIDHANGVRDDNSILNLRPASFSENNINIALNAKNTSGFRGVHRAGSTWRARIRLSGQVKDLGRFPTAEEASRAYEAAAEVLHGEFRRSAPNAQAK